MTRWRGLYPKHRYAIACQNIQVAVTGTTDETELFSDTISGGMMGPNGILSVWLLASNNNSANAKTLKVYVGGTLIHSFAVTTSQSLAMMFLLSNRNDESAQIGNYEWQPAWTGANNNAVETYTINTSADITLQITGTLANSGDNLALEMIVAELIRK